ncbi:MAG: hypothetical protein QM650_15105 [Microlunatus sp.]
MRAGALGHWALVAGMLLAPWGFAITNLCYAVAIRGGGSDSTGAESIALFGAHPTLVRVGVTAGMIGCILLVPAVLGLFRLAPASTAVLVGGSLMIAGYICYFAVLHSSFIVVAMAGLGGDPTRFAAAIDASQADPWPLWVFLVFVLGNLVGTLVLAIGLLRSRAVPTWAAIAIGLWPPLHVIGLVFFGNEVPQVIGAVLQALGFAGCALVLAGRAREAKVTSSWSPAP